jgi:hypothetical protein
MSPGRDRAMSEKDVTEKCAHPPCKCTASTAGEYCSEHCEAYQGKLRPAAVAGMRTVINIDSGE